jgi:predicted RNase H-like nuclease
MPTPTTTRVVGADITRGRWALVVLEKGRFADALVADDLEALHRELPEAAVIAVDIPIGLPAGGADWPRACDGAARRFVGPRGSSVFTAPPRPVLDAPSYGDAGDLHEELTGVRLSRQAWGLRAKILETEAFVAAHPERSVIEVHPEVVFRALNGGHLQHPKKTWNGENRRRRLLAAAGILLSDDLPEEVSRIPHDDILDAAAAAWTAHRHATGRSRSILEEVAASTGPRLPTIWF